MSASFARTLIQQLHLETSRSITLIGAGGKTTLLYALSTALAQKENTLLTTTTHIMEPRDLPGAVSYHKRGPGRFGDCFPDVPPGRAGDPCFQKPLLFQCPCICRSFVRIPKNCYTEMGISFSFVSSEKSGTFLPALSARETRSRRLPVKIPREGEPVFFPGTDTVIGVIGLSCLGQSARDCLFGMGSGRHPAGISRTARCPWQKATGASPRPS